MPFMNDLNIEFYIFYVNTSMMLHFLDNQMIIYFFDK